MLVASGGHTQAAPMRAEARCLLQEAGCWPLQEAGCWPLQEAGCLVVCWAWPRSVAGPWS
jgi:hypothetical protein